MRQNDHYRREWAECPRDPNTSRWATLYATLNPKGDIVLSRFTFESLGSPEHVVLMYDERNHTIGVRPKSKALAKNAYPVRASGRYGGKVIRGYRLCREFGIRLENTVRFPFAHIENEVLILDLRDTEKATRVK